MQNQIQSALLMVRRSLSPFKLGCSPWGGDAWSAGRPVGAARYIGATPSGRSGGCAAGGAGARPASGKIHRRDARGRRVRSSAERGAASGSAAARCSPGRFPAVPVVRARTAGPVPGSAPGCPAPSCRRPGVESLQSGSEVQAESRGRRWGLLSARQLQGIRRHREAGHRSPEAKRAVQGIVSVVLCDAFQPPPNALLT